MRFLTYDELAPDMDLDRTLIHLAAFFGTFPRRSVELWRRRSKAYSDYVAVFAEEKGRVLGQVFVLRIPYTFPGGTEIIGGIAAVGTRPDRGRSGVARAVLSEVHRRERESGIRYTALWTNRSWGAHGLYEKLGYRDVYSSPWVVHGGIPTRRKGARSFLLRAARREDLLDIERFHAQQTEGRLGFSPRAVGFLRTAAAAGELDPVKELIVARRAGRLVGYVHLEQNAFRTFSGELVATTRAIRRELISAVGHAAKGLPFAFQHTPVTDDPDLFAGGGFATSPRGWYGLMGHDLQGAWSPREALRQFATEDPRFSCMSGDRF
jgi:GNAT superfamily N-acetyltransferase